MNKGKPDRRVVRTRKRIQDALVDLILEKDYEKITVQDILDRADVGRSTFYAHYQDKEDLLLRGVAEIAYGEDVKEAVSADIEELDRKGIFDTITALDMFLHVEENGNLHKAMFKKNTENAILEKGAAFLKANLEMQLERLRVEGVEPAVPIPVLAYFLTGGLMSLMEWWLENDIPYSPQELDALFQKIAMPGVLKVIRGAEN